MSKILAALISGLFAAATFAQAPAAPAAAPAAAAAPAKAEAKAEKKEAKAEKKEAKKFLATRKKPAASGLFFVTSLHLSSGRQHPTDLQARFPTRAGPDKPQQHIAP